MSQHQIDVILNFWGPIPILIMFGLLVGLIGYEVWLLIWQVRGRRGR